MCLCCACAFVIYVPLPRPTFFFFFFNDTATTEIYTLSLHDALPICPCCPVRALPLHQRPSPCRQQQGDRKSTRLNSSHQIISYAVFCLKKKNIEAYTSHTTHDNDLRNHQALEPYPLRDQTLWHRTID